MPYIYKITNLITNQLYVGKTRKTIEQRFEKHKLNSRYNNTNSTYLSKAMQKYGPSNFIIECLEEVSDDRINEKEREYIAALKPHYNMTSGGEGGDTSKSPNFIAAMKKHHASRPRESYATYGMLGKKQSDKNLQAIKLSNRCPVMCDGVRYDSVGEASKHYPGIKVRGRLDNPKYPTFYRLRERTRRK
jgi:group I intron endonuclease